MSGMRIYKTCFVGPLIITLNHNGTYNDNGFFGPSFKLYDDSVHRITLPGEALSIPITNAPTGKYLLDRDLISKIATLRTFIENIETNRGKISTVEQAEDLLNGTLDSDSDTKGFNNVQDLESEICSGEEHIDEPEIVPINEETLTPVKELLCEENLLEEVLGAAFGVYRQHKDTKSIQRLDDIANKILPIAAKFRKDDADGKVLRLIACFTNGEEDFDDVLEQMQNNKQLNKYLVQRLDEMINLAVKKFRISDKHPASSENLLRIIKDRVAAQQISGVRGTAKFIRIMAECFVFDDCADYENVLRHHLKKIEDIEEFHSFVGEAIEYCRENKKLQDKIFKMESIESLLIRLHPIWTPVDDHVEPEPTAMEEEERRQSLLQIEKETESLWEK